MAWLQVRCKCNKIIASIDNPSDFDVTRIRKLAEKGYVITIEKDERPGVRALEPCDGRPCPFRNEFSTSYGFKDILRNT